MALRLGLRMIRGLPKAEAQRILQSRQNEGMFTSISQLTRRVGLGQAVLSLLADAGALESLVGDRRTALWETLGQERRVLDMPLLGDTQAEDDLFEGAELLDSMSPLEEVYADYNATGLSLRGHPLEFCRAQLAAMRCVTATELPGLRHGRPVRVAGLVLLRQRPGTAKGITFVTLEDETGSMNLIIHPGIWKKFFTLARTSNAWMVRGTLENRKGVIHVVVGHLEDLTDVVDGLELRSRDFR